MTLEPRPSGHEAQPSSPLRRRLVERIHASLAHERQFLTQRRDTCGWDEPQPGVRRRVLVHTAVGACWLVELTPGTRLATTPGFSQAELVLLDGTAKLAHTPLHCGDAVLAPHDPAHAVSAGEQTARLFLRLSAPPQAPAGVLCFSTLVDGVGWDDFRPGVRVRALWSDGQRSSLLVRMRAGASVSEHGHPLDEECMMLAGEAFVGDTLLRSGEFQWAPGGSRHGAVTTDVGALFFVHGSLDPAAYA